jgi:hypothetical protein
MSLSVCCFSTFNMYYNFTSYYIGFHNILFSDLSSINHKCTHPCYFPTTIQTAAQKLQETWNSSMRSSILALALPIFL